MSQAGNTLFKSKPKEEKQKGDHHIEGLQISGAFLATKTAGIYFSFFRQAWKNIATNSFVLTFNFTMETRGQQTFFRKGPDSKHFRLVGNIWSLSHILLCCFLFTTL